MEKAKAQAQQAQARASKLKRQKQRQKQQHDYHNLQREEYVWMLEEALLRAHARIEKEQTRTDDAETRLTQLQNQCMPQQNNRFI